MKPVKSTDLSVGANRLLAMQSSIKNKDIGVGLQEPSGQNRTGNATACAVLHYPGAAQRKKSPVGDGRFGGGQSGSFTSLCPIIPKSHSVTI